MKFQNCILINFERTHGRMDGRTDKPKSICPFNFSKVGGVIQIKQIYALPVRIHILQHNIFK